LESAITKFSPTVLFEFVGGDFAGSIFKKMPILSTMVVVGNLTYVPLTVD